MIEQFGEIKNSAVKLVYKLASGMSPEECAECEEAIGLRKVLQAQGIKNLEISSHERGIVKLKCFTHRGHNHSTSLTPQLHGLKRSKISKVIDTMNALYEHVPLEGL